VGPFASEGASFVALHNEFAHCAAEAFAYHHRPNRSPDGWSSIDPEDVDDPETFVADNKIGWPTYNVEPQRKISWWFNSSMLQYALLDEAGVAFDVLAAGALEPVSCP
jgi:hypothetical protein